MKRATSNSTAHTTRAHRAARRIAEGESTTSARVVEPSFDTLTARAWALAQEVFGLGALRAPQVAAVNACLAGRDVVVMLATGAGKSLCYQLPAVVLARSGLGPTLVVSPLIALMEDQVQRLRALGVSAHALHGGVPWAEQRRVLAGDVPAELIFASPERLSTPTVKRALSTLRIARLAVDEAHCISEWGHDFRPEFSVLGALRASLGVPAMALTATATLRVQEELVGALQLDYPEWVVGSTRREALRFEVDLPAPKQTRTAWAVAELSAEGFAAKRTTGRALVYALTRRRVQEVHRALKKAGIRAGYYHAGRTDKARSSAHTAFAAGRTPVLVATSAYGMGVDLPDVRLVLHVESPETLEAYVQQAGRAGRGGEAARCVLAYSAADEHILLRLRGRPPTPGERAGQDALAAYAGSLACRQLQIGQHFGDSETAPCARCDICTDFGRVQAQRAAYAATPPAARKLAQRENARTEPVALADDALAIVVAFVDGLRKPLGRGHVAKALRGSRARGTRKHKLDQNPHFGALASHSESSLFAAIDQLLARGNLVKKGVKYPTLWPAAKAVRPRSPTTRTAAPRDPIRAALMKLRTAEAKRRRVKPYQVFPNRTLTELCTARPHNEEALRAVWGLGDERVRRYGSDLLRILGQ